jgi:hypothetical protein
MTLSPLRSFTVGALLVLGFTCLAGRAQAQVFKVCGDVDGNKTVTVTDGVQVLRAAAGLSTDCTDAICDVDVSGAVTVTDGVITLRKAAGLSITENCIPDDGRIDPQVAYILQFSAPLVLDVLPTVVQRRNEVVDNSFECDNFSDGTYEVSFLDGEQDGTFDTCYFDNAVIDGDVENSNTNPLLTIEISDARNDDTMDFEGTDDSSLLGVNLGDGGIKYSGRLDVSPSFDRFSDTSDFLLVLNNVQVASSGYPLGGSLQYVFNEDSGVPDVREVRVFYDGSNLARVEVTFTNGDFQYYKFELKFLNFI